MLDIEAIKGRLNDATPGPWKATYPINRKKASITQVKEDADGWSVHICDVLKEDAELIANAPTDLAACVAEIERLTGELEWLNKELRRRASLYGDLTAHEILNELESRQALQGGE